MYKNIGDAFTQSIKNRINESEDRFIRIDLSSNYPIADIVVATGWNAADFVIGFLSPFVSSELENLGYDITFSAAKLTQLRNTAPKDRATVVIFGKAFGNEESGLRDLSDVVTERELIAEWLDGLLQSMSSFAGIADLRRRYEFLDAISQQIRSNQLNPFVCEEILKILFDFNSSLSLVQDKIFEIGLIPDDGLIAANKIRTRLKQNSDLINRVLSGDDTTLLDKIRKSNNPKVRNFNKWISSRSDQDLSNSSLKPLLELLIDDLDGT